MEGWEYWKGKRVYLILKNKRQYQGKVLEVLSSKNTLCWITILDKFNKRITFETSEIELIQEEG